MYHLYKAFAESEVEIMKTQQTYASEKRHYGSVHHDADAVAGVLSG